MKKIASRHDRLASVMSDSILVARPSGSAIPDSEIRDRWLVISDS
jgi:hypothetical protein